MSAYDVLLRGGTVVDGAGGPPYTADIGVRGARIEAIGQLTDATGRTEVDATGRMVLPGFVDTHVHADAVLTRPDVQEAMLRQGITSVILGQDGLSFAPGSAATVDYVARYFAAVDGTPPEPLAAGCTVADLLAYYDRRTPLNVAYLVPLGTVRHEVLGPDDRPAGTDLPALVRLVEQGLDDGAVGVSTGLEYVPGAFADLAELTALCRPGARLGAPYVSHLRSYDGGTAPGMPEAQALGRATGIPVHVSHYRGLAEPLVGRLEDCRADGVDATFDSYPHLYGNTILAMKALPPHVQAGGVNATLRRLAEPEVRATLAREWFPAIKPSTAPAIFGYVASEKYRWAEGLTVAQASARTGLAFADLICEILLASDLAVGAIIPTPGGDESDLRALLRDDRHMGCSDAIYLGGHPHPRGWGAFARFLGHHTRDLGDWTWAQAAAHLAGRPAERFQLAQRGMLAESAVADIVVFDPHTVADRATYDDPRQLAVGVSDVLVGGELVLSAGTLTGATPGRALRRGEPGL
ncbi:N-acyl-D-amino-acid deacylase family protein [Actinopolymorpha alba]|uniref:N-acyl-D-amino-acid deacylase family protein n=1 Tax=Actinopolymorpha alba TaxID=533267 RepID=UPI00037C9BF4|nr:amidohydrolase family protein [Actinopolymorpha alba]